MKRDVIIGTAIGDIAGSRFEINNCKTGKDFILLHNDYCRFTDDTVMTFAVAKALTICEGSIDKLKDVIVDTVVEVGRRYLDCGFGPSFYYWLKNDEHKPYGSFGNGAAMRISPVAVIFKDEDKIKQASACITNISHNHEDSIKGAEAVCMAIHMALNDKTIDDIKSYIDNNYFRIDEVNKELKSSRERHINCVETVKRSLEAFYKSTGFEDAIRNAIAIGGDSDTIAAITGGIAAAYYGIPENIYNDAIKFLDEYLLNIHSDFCSVIKAR